jgi:CheY-like chemotaxis protein
LKVLIIDDEEDTRSIASMSLSILGGVDVVEAEGGLEGIAKAEQDRPDVILLDMMMPVMDGSQTLQELLKNPRTADIPVIFLTAKAMTSEIERLTRMGAIAVLTKPFDPTTLAAQVEKILSNRGLHVTPSSGNAASTAFDAPAAPSTAPAPTQSPNPAPSAPVAQAPPVTPSNHAPTQGEPIPLLPPQNQQGIQIAQSSGLVSSAGGYFPAQTAPGQGTALNTTFPDLPHPGLAPQPSPWQALARPVEAPRAPANYPNFPNQPQPNYSPPNGGYTVPGAPGTTGAPNQTYTDPYGNAPPYNQSQNVQMGLNYNYQAAAQQQAPPLPQPDGFMLTPQQRQQIMQQSVTSDYAQLPPRNNNRPLNQNFPQVDPAEQPNFVPNYPRVQQGMLELPHQQLNDKQRLLQQQSVTAGYDAPGGTIGQEVFPPPHMMPNQQAPMNNYQAPPQPGQAPPQSRLNQSGPQSAPTLPPGYQANAHQAASSDPWVTAANENVQTSSAHEPKSAEDLARTYAEINPNGRTSARSSGTQPAMPEPIKSQTQNPRTYSAPQPYTPPAQLPPPTPPQPPAVSQPAKTAPKTKPDIEKAKEREKDKEAEKPRFSHPWGPQHKPDWSGDADPLKNGYDTEDTKKKNDKNSDKDKKS